MPIIICCYVLVLVRYPAWVALLLVCDSLFFHLFCSDAHMLMEDIKRTVSELEQDSSLPAVGVELVDNELAMLYMNSRKSEVTQTE